jgi:hypothetical protein
MGGEIIDLELGKRYYRPGNQSIVSERWQAAADVTAGDR